MTQRLLCFCLLLLAFVAPRSKADATYTYTGNAFTGFFGSDSCSGGIGECQVTGTVTLAAPLAPNMNVVCCGINVTPVSFSFSNGAQTITNLNGTSLIVDTNPPALDQRFYRAVSQ